MLKYLLLLASIMIVGTVGVITYQQAQVQSNGVGVNVASTDTIGTFRTAFNALDNYVRSTTSTLGTFSNLATTTGNLPVASTTNGWNVLAVGSNDTVLTASSGASLGVTWATVSASNAIVTSTAVTIGHFPYWNTARALNGTSSLRYATSTNLLLFASGASSSQLWSASSSFSGTSFFSGDIGATGTRVPNGYFTNIDSTNGTIGTLIISSVVSGDLVVNGGNVNLASTTKTYKIGDATVISSSTVFGVVSSTVQTGSFSFPMWDATKTTPYAYVKTQIPFNINITQISCDEFASASTNTIAIYRATSTANLAIDSVILASLGCGTTGTSTTSFTTTTVLAGQFIVASTTATAGTPSWTTINVKYTK